MGHKHLHRTQITRATRFIKNHLHEKVTLKQIAEESGISHYYFIRVFTAYTGETPFSYIRRERISHSLKLLSSDLSITQIALDVGFETPSSFNKAFKKETSLTPREFRNLGEVLKKEIIHNVYVDPKTKEFAMKVNMPLNLEIISRSETTVFSFSSKDETFKEAAPVAWDNFLKIIPTLGEDLSQSEFLGIGEMFDKECLYKAAISLPSNPEANFSQLKREVLPASKYARFLLTGSYEGVWPAFDKAVKFIHESNHELGTAPYLENYLNDPSITPEEELLTEILIPLK